MKAETNEKKELTPGTQTMQQAVAVSSPLFESGGEFVLPDYLPKVQKVLRLEANALPPTKYMSGGEAQMRGSVLHTLIYLGEDGEMSAAVLPSKYEFSVPTAGQNAPEAEASVRVDSLTYRLSAPRKINIRTRLAAKPQVLAAAEITPRRTPEKIDGLHTLESEADCVETHFIRLPDIELADSIEVSSADVRPIWCGATAAVTDVRTTADGATLRGDAYVKVLVQDGDTPKMLRKKIPFEERLDAELARGTAVTACADVFSTEAGREPDGGGIYVECVVSLTCRTDTPCRVSVTADAFSEYADGTVEMQKLPTARFCFARSGVYGAGGSLPLAGMGLGGADSVLDASGTVMVDEVGAADGSVTITGRCTLNVICHTPDGIAAGEGTIPVRLTLDAETPAGIAVTASARLADLRARIDGDNLICDADVALTAQGAVRGEVNAVSAIDFTAAKPVAKCAYPLAVVYPCGDSLWTVAKENHTDPARLAELNHLATPTMDWQSPASLYGKNSLILENKQ